MARLLITHRGMRVFEVHGSAPGTTSGFAINARGQLEGDYLDADGADHGYLRTPAAGAAGRD